jgi:hypothetical protein
LRWIARLLGFVALFLGFATLGLMAAGRLSGVPVVQPVGELWYTLDSGSLNALQALVERTLWPPLWDYAVFPLLRAEAPFVAIAALLLAVVLFLLGRGGGKSRGKRIFDQR